MSWYVIDAVGRAIERTRTCLIEPFDLWKWIKLAIIAFFVGSGSGFNSGGNGGSYGDSNTDFSDVPAGLTEIMDTIQNFFASHSVVALMIGIVLAIILFVLVMSIISSVMEFVFVGSLVSNDVQIRKYFKRYFGKGLSLFVLRILLGLVTLTIFGLAALLFLSIAGISFASLADPDSINFNALLLMLPFMILFLIAVLFVVALIMGVINSFINMAIPVSMYSGISLFSGLSRVVEQFRRDWQQIIIYWIGRLILGIAVGIAVAIVGVIVAVLVLIVLALVAFVCYFIFSALVSDTTVWILLIPIVIVEFILFIFVMSFVSMPAKVFMKYHMLTFLQMWYPVDLPIFDSRHNMYKGGNGNIDDGSGPVALPEE
ncbi:hypothetical protein [Methanolobus sp. WCC4]|uniref:DUF7544 domain-containing protein n=1 Tax=Methanolobus sp. WCC4 TaxID=3125784 RepID=UPI0030FBB1A6